MARPAHDLPAPVRYDETRGPGGVRRPGWGIVLDRLDSLGRDGVLQRQHEIERQLRSNGVGFSPQGPFTADARPWQLDLVPMVVEPADWAALSAGVLQRARLKRALLADVYGEQRLLAERVVPPALVYAHPAYLRDAVGIEASGRLPLYACDVSRAPNGEWYVADDICQYPEGLGYTLENRLVLSRVLPQTFRTCRVRRVAGWFRALQSLVLDRMERDARCVLLGHGPSHPHYFEVAWLAKYLGYTLVEIGDLTVRGERVFLKTVAGLQRVDVILRFVEDHSIDPLVTDARPGPGLPGLLRAVRAGGVELVNPIGCGVVDNPALNAWLPELCEALLGEPLALRSAPTYWLGDAHQRRHVLGKFERVLFRDVDAHGVLDDPLLMSETGTARLRALIDAEPERVVAQERVDRSVAPVLHGTRNLERQVTVRLFAVDGNEDLGGTRRAEVLPGGLCLLDEDAGGRRQRFDELDASKDVWVVSDAPVLPDSLLPGREGANEYAVVEGELPSRVGDNLFWLGRNAERVEATARLLRAVCRELQDDDSPVDSDEPTPALAALLRATTAATGTEPGFGGRGAARRLARPDRELHSLLHAQDRLGTLCNALATLQFSAVRDRVSPELLLVLNELGDAQRRLHANARITLPARDPQVLIERVEMLDRLLGALAAFAGLTHENFTHGDGWSFLMIGRRISRASIGATVLRTMLARDTHDSRLLESLLRLFDSVMTYRSRYRSRVEPRLAVHLLAIDETNPRSLAFQFVELDRLVRLLPGVRPGGPPGVVERHAVAGVSRVRLAEAGALMAARGDGRQSLARFLEVLESIPAELGEALTARYFSHVETRRELTERGGVTIETIVPDGSDGPGAGDAPGRGAPP